jgi:glycerol-3-phosphate dehydrogenase (NAD(P)+)
MNCRIAFVGAGRWALALGLGFARAGADVVLWEPDAPGLARLLATRRHPDLPDDSLIPDTVELTGELDAVLADAEVLVFATPSGSLGTAAAEVAPRVTTQTRTIVTVTKGIDPISLRRLSEVLVAAFKTIPVVVLAGPGIPYEFASGDPTSLVAASDNEPAARYIRDLFTADNLRVYSSSDTVGVELGAALKNVVALAAGIADSIGLGINARAALITRGLAEMTRLGIAMNANPLTFAGLSGVGDLVVTAFSDHSRNHTLGCLIGRGSNLQAAQAQLNGVAEGAVTARSALALAARHHIEMPIAEEVCRILYDGIAPRKSLGRLLNRRPRKEGL